MLGSKISILLGAAHFGQYKEIVPIIRVLLLRVLLLGTLFISLTPGLSNAAYALIANAAAGSTAGNTITTSGVDTSGANFLVCAVSWHQPGGVPTISDSKSNSYTGLTITTSGTNLRTQLHYVANATVGTSHTFTSTGTLNYSSIACLAFSGGKTTSPFDVQNGLTQTTGSSIQPGSITPSENNELVIAAFANETANVSGELSVNGGFTILGNIGWHSSGQEHQGIAISYLIQTTAAAANPTFSWSTGTVNQAVIASFKAAVSDQVYAPVIIQ